MWWYCLLGWQFWSTLSSVFCWYHRNSRHSMYLPPLSGKSHRSNQSALLQLPPQATRGLSFCSLSLLGPLFCSSPLLVCFPPLGSLNSAFLSFLRPLFRRIPALRWVLTLDKLCKMNSVSLVIQLNRLLWWGMLKGNLLIIRSQAFVWLVDF